MAQSFSLSHFLLSGCVSEKNGTYLRDWVNFEKAFWWMELRKSMDRTIIIDMPLNRKGTVGGSTRVFCPFSSRRYICCI